MTTAQLKKLEREWAAKLRADGFQDIESPSGMLRPWDERRGIANTPEAAQLAEERARGEALRFASVFEEKVWGLHLEGLSNRAIAGKLCVYRKLVNETLWGLRARLERPGPGRRRDPASMRSEAMRYELRLTGDVRQVVEHLRHVLPKETSVAAMVRLGLLGLALKFPRPSRCCERNTVRTGIARTT